MRSSSTIDTSMSAGISSEWCLLQNQFDSYEKYSLLLKIVSIAVVLCGLLFDTATVFIAGLVLVIWLQDAIWKTFQSRIEIRLLRLEAELAGGLSSATVLRAYQFNTEYAHERGNTRRLVMEYGRQALRPTVAYPHLVLVMMYALHIFCYVI